MASIIILAALVMLAMGRTPWYKYGSIQLWSGNIWSNQNSQQIADPYTFTHITHGIVFFWLLWLAARRQSLSLRAILAIALESAWEVFENTDMVIQRYRAVTLSLDYYGDSVINSVFDILACGLGFMLAARFPARTALVGIIILEIGLALWIKDNVFLNILMLIYPIPAVKAWQYGG